MRKSKYKNITLIGMPGVGKSVLGKKLAKKLGYKFLDIDKVIKKQIGLELQEIIDKFGEKKFLEIEEGIILNLGHINNYVISPGGSIVYSEKAMLFLKKISKVIFLHASFESIKERLWNMSTRGIIGLRGKSLKELYKKRNLLYKKYADIVVEVPDNAEIRYNQRMKQKKLSAGQSQEISDLLSEYSKALSLLGQYDAGTLTEPKGAPAKFVLKYEDCVKIIKDVRAGLIKKKAAGSLFGSERGELFEGVVKNLYQTFGKKELYSTVEKKAAHLLYLVIKDHPFSDGNKRIAAFLFVYFLNKNNYLHKENGERKIDNNALVALALLIAESNPKEKDVMVKIIANILSC